MTALRSKLAEEHGRTRRQKRSQGRTYPYKTRAMLCPRDKWFEVTVLEEPSIARPDLILVRVKGEVAPRRINIERLEEQP